MYLWRSLPEGQLLAVLRWMSSRRQRQAVDTRLAGEAAPASLDRDEKALPPLR